MELFMSKSKSAVSHLRDEFFDASGNFCTLRPNGTYRVQSVNNLPSMTIQSEKDSCDVNKIVSKYKTTGILTNINKSVPLDFDDTDIHDFHSAMNQLVNAQDAFMTLPASLRKRFANDPGNLLDFLNDPENRSEAVKLGLVSAPQDSQIPLGVNTPPATDGGLTSGD